jgi:transposase
VPTTRAFKECSSRFPCKIINEFRTSKIYYEDDSILERVAFKDAPGKKDWLRGLLWCRSTNNSKFVNRDFNGAMNILRCALQEIRPLALQRQENQERIIDRLGKKIKRCHNA